MSKPLVSIVLPVNDIKVFHGGSRSGLKKKISYFDQFLILYESIKKNWVETSFEYNIYLLHSIEFTAAKKKILKKLDVTVLMVDYPKHQTKIRPMAYQIDIFCDYRLVLDVDMIALSKPNFDFECDFQAMYGGNKFNKRQWQEICAFLNCSFPSFPILKLEEGTYTSWGINEMYLYQTGQINQKLFPYFNNGAILIKNSLSHKFVDKWEASRELYTKYVKLNFNQDIDLEGQDVIGVVLNNLSLNWKPFDIGINFPLQEHFSSSKKMMKIKNTKNISLVHYINLDKNFRWSNMIFWKYLKVKSKFYGISYFNMLQSYSLFLFNFLVKK